MSADFQVGDRVTRNPDRTGYKPGLGTVVDIPGSAADPLLYVLWDGFTDELGLYSSFLAPAPVEVGSTVRVLEGARLSLPGGESRPSRAPAGGPYTVDSFYDDGDAVLPGGGIVMPQYLRVIATATAAPAQTSTDHVVFLGADDGHQAARSALVIADRLHALVFRAARDGWSVERVRDEVAEAADVLRATVEDVEP